MTFEVVLDKSYLDGAPTSSVRFLCDNFTVLLSDELFYELMTTRPESQKRCFSKLPNRRNPVALIPNVGSLLRYEREHNQSCTPISRHKLGDDYIFNRKLREGSFVIEGEVLENLEAWKTQVANDTKEFIERWVIVHQFFPELNGIEWKEFPEAIRQARRKIATDYDFVRSIYASFLDEDAPPDSPKPEALDANWGFFRWVQCQILNALRLFARYQGKLPNALSEDFVRKAEHSMIDTYFVILGSLAGAMATLDEEIREDLLLLCPDCFFVSPKVVTGGG